MGEQINQLFPLIFSNSCRKSLQVQRPMATVHSVRNDTRRNAKSINIYEQYLMDKLKLEKLMKKMKKQHSC